MPMHILLLVLLAADPTAGAVASTPEGVTATAGAVSDEEGVRMALATAKEHLAAGRADEAAAEARFVLAIAPSSREARELLERAAAVSGHVTAPQPPAAPRGADSSPEMRAALARRFAVGRRLMETERYVLAEREFRLVAELDPADQQARSLAERCRRLLDEFVDDRMRVATEMRAAGRLAGELRALSDVLAHEPDHAEALRRHASARERVPGAKRKLHATARSLSARGEWTEALRRLDEALELDADDIAVSAARDAALEKLSRPPRKAAKKRAPSKAPAKKAASPSGRP